MLIGTKRIEECQIYDDFEGVFHYAPGQYVEVHFDADRGWMWMDSELEEADNGPFTRSNEAWIDAHQHFDIVKPGQTFKNPNH